MLIYLLSYYFPYCYCTSMHISMLGDPSGLSLIAYTMIYLLLNRKFYIVLPNVFSDSYLLKTSFFDEASKLGWNYEWPTCIKLMFKDLTGKLSNTLKLKHLAKYCIMEPEVTSHDLIFVTLMAGVYDPDRYDIFCSTHSFLSVHYLSVGW